MRNCPSRSEEWERVRTLENALALVSQIDDRRRVIRALSFHETNWDQVHREATAMRGDVAKLKKLLSKRWEQLFAEVTGDGDEAETR